MKFHLFKTYPQKLSMSSWGKAKSELGNLVKELKSLIPEYDYSSRDKSKNTDREIRNKVIKEFEKSREFVLNMIELAYKDKETRVVENLQEVVDEIDLLINELGIEKPFWNSEIDENWMKEIVKSDLLLIKNSRNFSKIMDDLNNRLIQGVVKEDWIRKSQEFKKYIDELRVVLKERCKIG